MANVDDAIPLNADKILFVEDLINFVLSHNNGVTYPALRAGDFREFIYNGFNEDIRKAVEYTIHVLEWEIDDHFSEMHERNSVNIGSFVNYARKYKHAFFNEGFEPGKFLAYSVRLVSLATYFAQYHVNEALDMSLEYILAIFEEYDMYFGGWDAINNVAKRCVVLARDLENLQTPESSDFNSDESSDLSEDEDERNVYPLQRLEMVAEQFDELPNHGDNEEQGENKNCMEGGRDFYPLQRLELVAKQFDELPNRRDSKEQGENKNCMEGGRNLYPLQKVKMEAKKFDELPNERHQCENTNCVECGKNLYPLELVELEAKKLEELPNQKYSKERYANSVIMENGVELGGCVENMKVHKVVDYESFIESPSQENSLLLENRHCYGGFASDPSTGFGFPNEDFDSFQNPNYDRRKSEDIDCSLINQKSINIFIDKLQKLASQKRDYEQNLECVDRKFKRLKYAEADCFEGEESFNDSSNLHEDEKTGCVLQSPSEMLPKNKQLVFQAPVNKMNIEINDSGHRENFSERMSFVKNKESCKEIEEIGRKLPRTSSNQIVHKEELLNRQNIEPKSTNPRFLCSETSSNIEYLEEKRFFNG